MKKLSFFLMAMLFSVMSFAAEVTETVTMKGFAGLSTSAYENVTKTGASDKGTAMVAYAFNPSTGQVRGNKTTIAGASVTSKDDAKNWSLYNVDAMAGAIKSIKITCAADGSNYFKNNMYVALGTSSQGAVTTISGAQKNTTASNAEFTFDIDATKGYTYFKLLSNEKFTSGSVKGVVVTITYEAADNYVAVPSITGETYFKENTTVTLTASEGQKVYYTLDGTEPTNASTEYTAPFELTETTTVKAIAYQGENASEVAEQVFKKMQVLTCAEAAAITPNGDKYIVRGYVTKANEYSAQYNNIDFFVADTKDGGEVLKAYRAIPVTEEDKAVKEGDYVEIIGVLSAYNGTVQVAQGGTYTIIPEPTPEPVKYTVTVTAENGTVEGAGEYEEGTEITLTATPNEGYEFVNWTENEVEVSTDAEYTFAVLADRNLVANFVEAAPEINYDEFIMSNLVVTTLAEGLEMLEASDPVNGISVMLGVYEDGTLHEDCLITFQGTELSIVSSEKVTKEYNEDVETDVYTVRVVVAFGGANMGLQLLMYATAAAEPIIINVEGATVTLTEYQISAEETAYELNMISNWVYEEDGLTYEVECLLPTFDPTKESGDYEASFFVRGEGNAVGMTEDAIVSVAKNGNQITLTGEITAYNSNVYNVTISGTLPVVEPTTITWELNGGEVAAVVPTNEELWKAFKPYYNTFYGEARADQPITLVATFMTKGEKIMTDETSEYKWLGDYLLKVANEQIANGTLTTYTGITTEVKWRFATQAFFNCSAAVDKDYSGNPDFTEAGKPENWGPAYQAAHEVVLPTEPVEEDYVLPTPVKEGYTFVGWYDNADGEGEAMTVLPAGWAGTLYAIWKVEGPATALENIAVEGKAVKAIINGQLIIIKNGVQYNAQGQVVK